MNFFKRFTGHFNTVMTHKYYVFKGCVKAGITWQGIKHDMSKFSPVEFMTGVRYFQGNRSPNEMERVKYGYSAAWLHHKGRNRHHYEYWTDYDSVTKKVVPVRMPLKYVKEMFCDRVAACKTYRKSAYTDSSALEYYVARKDNRDMHADTAAMLEKMLTILAEQGEDAAFEYVKNLNDYDI